MADTSTLFELPALRDRIKPFRLYWYLELGSTNDHAAELRKRGELFAPAIVLADRQTKGRGRGSNTWWSKEGSLTATFALPVDERIQPHQLPLVAGLAARGAAAELSGDNSVQLKWPNDLLYSWKKLGGLLCERVLKADLVGIGINVNIDPLQAPPELWTHITSLSQLRGGPVNMTDALVILASHLRLTLQRAADEPFSLLLREYDAHHALLGRDVCVTTTPNEPPTCGRCEGLDDIGRLLLRSGPTLHHVISGQVQMR
ncbi:MAG TPA: biotin--[acetyl-CoA-carboxylase] ligase [Tepidisphaeraceae bacterium]|nr:biotin--[acetyl-CoA-carboxylase] ligase [Tepidisphaeraceae bacterium]